jgi:tetratricopeptide (TPR) repeat protein
MAMQVDPSKAAEAHSNRGLAYASKGEYDNAIAEYTEAIRIDPQDAEAYHSRGLVYRKKGENEKAIADYSAAIRLNPENLHSYFARGVAYTEKHEYGPAIADYMEAIRLDRLGKVVYRFGERVTTYNNLAWLLAVCPHAEYRDGHLALEYALHACNLFGWQNPYVLGTLAAAYAEAGEFAQAIKWQTKAIEIATPDYGVPAAESRLELYKAGKAYRQE